MPVSRWLPITLILLLGVLTRGWHLAEQSFWVDEGYAFYHAHFPDLVTSLARDTHPPLYFAALRLWSELTGHSELALRWFSLLPSMLSLALIFQLAREALRERAIHKPELRETVPLLALLMLALADAENFLAQEARHYTWLVLLVLASMLFFLRWLRSAKGRDYGAFIVFGSLMLYTHYITAFLAITQGVYALIWLRGRQRRRSLFALMLSALALSPWLILVGTQQLGNRGANWSLDLSAPVLRDILVKFFSGQWALLIGLLLLGCVTLVYRRDSRLQLRGDRTTPLLLLWLILPFVLTVLMNEFLPFLQPRRLTQWTPAIALLVAMGLANIRQPIRAVLVAVLVVYGLTQVDFYRVKPDWHRVAEMTARYARPGDLVLTDIAGGDYQLGYYLRRQLGPQPLLSADIRYESLKIQRDFYSDSYEAWLPATLDAQQTVWLMHWSADRSAFAWLDELGFTRSADFVHVHDGGASGETRLHIYRYDRPADPALAIAFENGMILQSARFDQADLRLDTLWETARPLKRDTVISAKLLDGDGIVSAQHDGPPQLGQRPTTGWQVGELIYSPHEMRASAPLHPGEYRAGRTALLLERGRIGERGDSFGRGQCCHRVD